MSEGVGADYQGTHLALELPAGVVADIKREARAERKSVAHLLAELIEDRRDYLDAVAAIKSAKRAGEKPVPLVDVKKRLGLLHQAAARCRTAFGQTR